jgi:DNA-binding MarR family transcriptional regulator
VPFSNYVLRQQSIFYIKLRRFLSDPKHWFKEIENSMRTSNQTDNLNDSVRPDTEQQHLAVMKVLGTKRSSYIPEIAFNTKLLPDVVSQHLEALRKKKLVQKRRFTRNVYELTPKGLTYLIRHM